MPAFTQTQFDSLNTTVIKHLSAKFPEINFGSLVPPEYIAPEGADSNEPSDEWSDSSTVTLYLPRPTNFDVQDYLYSSAGFKFTDSLTKEFGWFNLRIEEETPDLVQAEIGDFVLIHSAMFPKRDAESDVGIVNSVWKKGRKRYYGCRYINFLVNDHLTNDALDRLQITEEDYGGYHPGFLKVLSPEEAVTTLTAQKVAEYKKARAELKESEKACQRDIERLVKVIADGKTVTTTKYLQIDQGDGYNPEIPSDLKMEERFSE